MDQSNVAEIAIVVATAAAQGLLFVHNGRANRRQLRRLATRDNGPTTPDAPTED